MSAESASDQAKRARAERLSDPSRWSQIVELFHAALDRLPTERDAFLRDACGSDGTLRAEVASLLRADEEAADVALEDLGPRAARSWTGDDQSPSLVGQRLDRYTIVAHLGSGGMGEVYRASDDALGRSVALKVLRRRVLHAPGLRGRLADEARAASALNHPNIVTVYEIGHHGPVDFIASELVDGETLGTRLARQGALPLRELVDIAVQIAAALGAAHEAGIVHRDVKPDNVMLRPDGLVKVVDFGLAKIVRRDPATTGAPSTMTQVRGVAGTLCYMSPEHSLGERLDHRTDLFSLGVVLYEMATGRRPFDGASEAAIYEALLHHAPPAPGTVRATLPPQLDLVVGRALEKDRELRYQSAADLAADLKRLHRPSFSGERPALTARRRPSPWLWQGATALAVAVSGWLGATLWFREAPAPGPDVQFTVGPPSGSEFALTGTMVPALTLTVSPDGRRLVYLAGPRGERPRLWLRALGSLDAVPLAGTEGATYPFWAPDGQNLAFFAGTSLKRIDLNGGAPRTLASGLEGRGGTWGANGTILVGQAEGPIVRVPSAGGSPTAVTALDAGQREVWHRFPQLLPDGRTVLYLVRSGNGARAAYVSSIDGRTKTKIVETDVRAAYAAPGHLLYLSEGQLMARRFDVARLALAGDPAQVGAAVATSSAQDASFAVSETGVLVYAPRMRAPTRLTRYDRGGRQTGVVGEVQEYLGLRRSPDGRTLVVTRADASSGPDLWVLDVARGVSSRFTFDPWIDIAPVWSPDGATIVFASSRLGRFQLFRRPAAGGPGETHVLSSPASMYPDDWSPDGRFVVYTTDAEPSHYDLALLRVDDLRVTPLLATPFDETQGRVSPDGRWLAYTSTATGRSEVHVRAFPSGSIDLQLSNHGGSEPAWRGDGRELFYLTDDGRLVAVAVDGSGLRFDAGPPRVLFRTGTTRPRVPYTTRYAAAADGQQFVVNLPEGEPAPMAITVRLDWRHALRGR